MALARAATHAILLGNGGVLIVGDGGFDVTQESSKAEIWDPTTAAWHITEGLNSPRADFAAIRLNDGRALVTGGRNQQDQSFSSTYVYDSEPGTWTKVGLLGTARTSPAIAALPDGRVLVAGGYFRTKPNFGSMDPGAVLAAYHPASLPGAESGGPGLDDLEPPNIGAALATAELYDPVSGSWSATGPMTFARVGSAAVTLADGRVLVFGSDDSQSGVTVDDRAATTAEIFDPASGRFGVVGALPDIDRVALQAAGVPGANPVPDDDLWVAGIGSLVALNDGGAVLVANAGWWKHVGVITRSFRFDARSGEWSEIGQTFINIGEPTAVPLVTREIPSLAGAMVAALPDGRILVAGGSGGSPNGFQYSNTFSGADAQVYDPTTDEWSALPPMPGPRTGGAVVTLVDGSILLVGGSVVAPPDGVEATLSSAVRYVP